MKIRQIEIGDRIRMLRNMYGKSQRQLSHEIGIGQRTISDWEIRRAIPNADHIKILSEYFQVSCDFLIKGK